MSVKPSRYELTRREFLAALPLAAAVACARQRYDRSEFVLPAQSQVALLPAAGYRADFADLITRGIAVLQPVLRGRRVLLKPNLVEYEAGTVINTHPLVIAGAIEAFRRAGVREVVVAEGPGHRRDMEYLLLASGLGDYLRELRVPFVDLNVDDVRPVTLRSRFMGVDQLLLPVEVLKADVVVSMAKLKTHHWAGMTAGMKNLFGVVPGGVYGWPKNPLHVHGIDASILDLNATIRPALAIVDAVVAMEGDGPIMGTPRQSGFLAIGSDVVAVDATCARIMGLDPERIGYLREASRYLGNIDPQRIRQQAENPARFEGTFELLDHLKPLRLRKTTKEWWRDLLPR